MSDRHRPGQDEGAILCLNQAQIYNSLYACRGQYSVQSSSGRMSASGFRRAAADMEEEGDMESVVHSEPEEELEEQPEDPEEFDVGQGKKRKKSANIAREFEEYDRWDRTDTSDEDILAHIRRHLNELNQSAGIQALPGSHKDRTNLYGNFQFRRKWESNGGKVLNTILSCPLRNRCGCQCQAKIVEQPTTTVLFIADQHTAADHIQDRDGGKYLKFQEMSRIASAVKVAPLQTATELIRNLQDSPTKELNPMMKKSVQRLVRRERKQINTVLLDNVEVDNTLGSISRLAEKMWMADAIEKP